MNKSDLVSAVAGKTEMPKAQVLSTIDAAIDVITKTLRNGGDVRLAGFGTFYVAQRKDSKGRNPRTGKPMTIRGGKRPKFKAGKAFKDSLA